MLGGLNGCYIIIISGFRAIRKTGDNIRSIDVWCDVGVGCDGFINLG